MDAVGLPLRVLRRIRSLGFADTMAKGWNIGKGLADYHLNPLALKAKRLPRRDWQKIRAAMEEAGLDVVPYRIDVDAFMDWLAQAAFPGYYVRAYSHLFIEKALEHYVSSESLDLRPGHFFADVAASNSPWFSIASRLYGVAGLAVDLVPPGGLLSGHKIAADATALPLRDGSIDAIALHCAYEMFEGDSDSRFIPEAARVLRGGGHMVILPLYMHHVYHADSCPLAERRGLDYSGALRVWREGPDRIRFSRKYDVPAFMERVARHRGPLALTIRWIENEHEVDPICYLKLAAVLQKA